MEGVWIALGVVGGLAVGGVVTWALARARESSLMVRLEAADQRLAELEAGLKGATADLTAAQSDLNDSRLAVTRLETELAERERNHQEKLDAYEAAKATMTDAFAKLANDALAESREAMQKDVKAVFDGYKEALEGEDESRRQRIERLLEPVKDSLTKLDEETKNLEKARNESHGALISKITALDESQLKLSTETTKLVRALQDSGQAGRWGEFVLARVFELAGLNKDVDYFLQETQAGETGNQRPDAVVRMPGGRELVIDSKAPMPSHLAAHESAEGDAEPSPVLVRDHANKLYDHARALNKRDYARRSEAVDFVVMFVPSESAFRSAAEIRPSLVEDCIAINVIIATPTTLLALLRAVSYGWQQERLATEAKKIQEDASRLNAALATMTEHYEKLGKSLGGAVDHFNSMGGSLERTVLPAARRFKDAGVPVTKAVVEAKRLDTTTRSIKAQELLAGQPSLEVVSDP